MAIEHISRKLIEYYLSNLSGIDIITDKADPNNLYIGIARSGSATSDAAWIIYRMKMSGNLVYERVADKSTDFSKKFDDRATFDYVEP